MGKLQANQILVKDAKLAAVKLNDTNVAITKLIDKTKQRQVEILKLKEIKQESLSVVVQL